MNNLFKYQGARFIIKFLLLVTLFYYFNKFYIGITAEGGAFYSSFLREHLNYIAWMRTLILHGSNLVAHGFGLSSYVEEPYLLRVNEKHVRIVYDCIGYGIMSFWLAFVIANKSSVKKKLLWGTIGIVSFFIANCFRIAILLFAQQNQWQINKWMDHHTMFNIVTYLLIFLFGYLYTKKNPLLQERFAIA